jgi:hypothetical protein
MLGSIHFMKYGAGILVAAIVFLLGTSVESHAQTGTSTLRSFIRPPLCRSAPSGVGAQR